MPGRRAGSYRDSGGIGSRCARTETEMTAAVAIEQPPTVGAPALPGNRTALVGVLLYFSEWVAIIGAGGMDVWFPAGTAPDKVLAGYAGHGNAFAWAAGWLAVALVGRILFAASVRDALRASGRSGPLADWSVGVMTLSVVVEVTTCAIAAGIAVATDHGASAETVTALDSVASAVEGMIWPLLGVSVLAMTLAMMRSGLFGRVLPIIGVVASIPLVLVGLAFGAPSSAGVANGLQAATGLMWLWMIWTGVLLWVRSRRTSASPDAG
jgi:hypothetical protein